MISLNAVVGGVNEQEWDVPDSSWRNSLRGVFEAAGRYNDALARSLNEPEAEISDVVNLRSDVSVGLAHKLSIHLNTTPDFWLNLQSTYELRSAQIECG